MTFIEAVQDPSGGWLLLLFIALVCTTWIVVVAMNRIADVKAAKYESFSRKYAQLSVPSYEEQDAEAHAYYDLYDYTKWLSEKGALREGFGEERLVDDYIAPDRT